MPTCPNCGEIVMNGDPYCSHCGTVLKWENVESDNFKKLCCPNCGEMVRNGDAYCSHCGTALGWGNDEPDNLDMVLKKRMDDALNDPNNLNLVYMMLANNEFDKGNYLNAFMAADKSIELDPQQDLAWLIKGEAAIKLGKKNEAIHCLSKSLDINSKNEAAAALLRDILVNGVEFNQDNIVSCSCGFKYNRRNYDYCPNCGRSNL